MKKKFTVLIIALILSNITAFAEDVIVASGTNSTNATPFNTYYYTAATQSLYMADEINKNGSKKGSITSLAFEVVSESAFTTYGVSIYLGLTSKSSFSTTADYVKESDLTLVYSSTPTIGVSKGWEEYTFNKPFEYDGHSNLVVVVCRKSNGQNQKLKYGYASKSKSVLTRGQLNGSGAQIDADYSLVTSTRPNLRLTFDNETQEDLSGLYDVVVGNDELASNFYPYAGPSTYSTTYSVYSPDEMVYSGKITDISYYVDYTWSTYEPEDVRIYMGYKDGDSFLNVNDHPSFSGNGNANGLQLVYSGSPSLGKKGGWETIPLNTPFNYDKSKSLVVAVCKKSSKVDQKLQYRYSLYKDRNVSLKRNTVLDEKFADIAYNDGMEMSNFRPNTKFRIVHGNISGDSEVVIGSADNHYDIYRVTSLYSKQQIIYTKNEIGSDMKITDISFNVAVPSPSYADNVSIYMAHTTEPKFPVTVFYPDGKYVDASEFKLVFSGPLTLGEKEGWERIHLNTPFEYDGKQNLVIAITRSSAKPNMELEYYGFQSENLYMRLSYANDYPITADLEEQRYSLNIIRPQIRIGGIAAKKDISGINYSFNDDYTATVISSPNASGDIEIPNKVTNGGSDYTVTSLANQAFRNNTNIRSVVLSESVTTIGDAAFQGCSNLESITMHNGIKTIGSNAFSGCVKLQSVALSSQLKEISTGLFDGCSGLISVELPLGIQKISGYAFRNCVSLINVHIPNTVVSIANEVFRGCVGLKELKIPDSVTSISNDAFRGCTGITELRIPESVISLGDGALSDCSGIERLIVLSKKVSLSSFNGSGGIIYAYKDNIYTNSYKHEKRVITNPYYAFYGVVSDFTSVSFCVDDIREDTSKPLIVSCNGSVINPDENGVYTVDNLFFGKEYEITITVPDVQPTTTYSHFIKTKEPILKQDSGLKNKETTIYIDMFCHTFTDEHVPVKLGVVCEDGRDISTTDIVFFGNEDYPFYRAYFVIGGFVPGTSYVFRPYAVYSNTDGAYIFGESFNRKTADVKCSVGNTITTPTTFTCDGIHEEGNAKYQESYFVVNGKRFDGDKLILTGLDPETAYHGTYTITVEEGDKSASVDFKFKTGKIEMHIPETIPMTASGTKVTAVTNISEMETNVGFQWRKYDAPESLKSNEGSAVLFDNKIQGVIKKLQSTSYYNVRAYYKSTAGNYYFSEWTTFDPTDFSYIEPVLHIYPEMQIAETSANIKYCIIEGSDEIINKGVQYWPIDDDEALIDNQRAKAVNSVNTVYITEQTMYVTLDNLQPGTKYGFRSFVTTHEGTIYGNEYSFTTKGEKVPTVVYDVNIGTEHKDCDVMYYDINGRRVKTPVQGFYIKKCSDGSVRKILVK